MNISSKKLSMNFTKKSGLKSKTKYKISSCLFLLIIFLNLSCTTTKIFKETYSYPEVIPVETLCSQKTEWTPIQEGFEITSGKINSQRVSWHCVKIDLDTPNLSIVYAPHSNTLGQLFRLKQFAKSNNTVIAINSNPFLIETTNFPVGIIKDNDKIISKPHSKYCALAFFQDKNNNLRADILNSQEEALSEKYTYAFGGFYTTMENHNIKTFQHNKRSRVGCGISDDGKYLYLFVCTPFFHPTDRNGLNYEECSLILKELGCDKAMQFDGGHSSGLCVYTKDIEKPFLQRKVPTAIGIKIEK